MEDTIHFHIDFRSGVNITTQIFTQVVDMAMCGILKPGDQLPTVRKLAHELKVNFNTVARAYRLLDEAGVISTQQGRGTYILPLMENNSPEGVQQIDHETRQYLQMAHFLGFSPDQLLAIFHRHFRTWKQNLSETEKTD